VRIVDTAETDQCLELLQEVGKHGTKSNIAALATGLADKSGDRA